MNGIDTGVEFNFSFAPETTDAQIVGFELAGEIWSQYLVDTFNGENLDINIHVEMGNDLLPDEIIGASFPTIEKTDYHTVRDALLNDVTSDVDETVAGYLQDYLDNPYSIDILVDGDVINDNFDMHTTSANLKALGIKAGNSSELDGYIVMNGLANSSFSWDYTYLDGPEAGELDFLSTALHEIGHTLGFVSGIDYSGEQVTNWYNNLINSSDLALGIAARFGVDSNTASITETSIMDLFRVSSASQNLGVISLTEGEAATFSIDGAISDLAMSTGADYQGSHWIESNGKEGAGVMVPTLGLGERWSISTNDLTVMDAIGWDVNYDAEIDLEALHNVAQSQVESAWIEQRFDAVDLILNTEAYNWSRRSSSNTSSSGFWWSSRSSSNTSSSGFWQVGYWSTYESVSGEVITVRATSEERDSSHFSEWVEWWREHRSGYSSWGDSNNSWGDNSWGSGSWGNDSWSKDS